MSPKVNPIIFRHLKNLGTENCLQQPYGNIYLPYVLNEHEQLTHLVGNFLLHFGVLLHSFRYIKTAKSKHFLIVRYVYLNDSKKKNLRLYFKQFEEAFAYGTSKILKTDQIVITFFDLSKNKVATNSPFTQVGLSKVFTATEVKKLSNLLISQYGSAFFLTHFLALKMSSLRSKSNKQNQTQILTFIKVLLNFVKQNTEINVEGIKVAVKGRINGIPRTKKWSFSVGVLSLQEIKNSIDYYYLPSNTVHGSFGIKVWINYGEKNVKTNKNKI